MLPAVRCLQLSAAQSQVSTLQSLVQQLEQEKQGLADASAQQQVSSDSMRRVLQGEECLSCSAQYERTQLQLL